VSCVPKVANVSGLFILVFSSVFSNVHLFVFVLCLAYRGLPVSLDCPFLIASSVFSNVYLFFFVLCLVCRGLPMSLDCPFLIASSVFSNVYLFFFVLCLVCRGLPISLDCSFFVAPRFSLTFICLSSSCVLCAEGCQYLWIVHSLLLLGFL
jgi:hypothetical protein